MSRPTKTCYDCKNACWDSVPYGSTTATMFGGCDKEDEMTESERRRDSEKQKTVHSGKTDTRRKTHEYTRCKKNI